MAASWSCHSGRREPLFSPGWLARGARRVEHRPISSWNTKISHSIRRVVKIRKLPNPPQFVSRPTNLQSTINLDRTTKSVKVGITARNQTPLSDLLTLIAQMGKHCFSAFLKRSLGATSWTIDRSRRTHTTHRPMDEEWKTRKEIERREGRPWQNEQQER